MSNKVGGKLAVYWAADVGGTKIRHAVISRDGELLEMWTWPTDEHQDPHLWAEKALAGWLATGYRNPCAVGLATPAVVAANGSLVKVPKLPSWDGFNPRKALGDGEKRPVSVIFDATASLVGEAWKGTSKLRDAVLLTIGTGIGGALMVDGRVLRGRHGLSGHPAVWLDAYDGFVEDVASGPALAEELGVETGVEALELCESGNGDAIRAFERASDALYRTIATVTGAVDVAEVVIAGGFGLAAFDRLFPSRRLPERYRRFPVIHDEVEIRPSQVGLLAPLFGAAKNADCELASARRSSS
jgi:glucokinase